MFILGGTLSKKLQGVTGGTFILGGTFQKNLSKAYRVRLLERVRLFGTRIVGKYTGLKNALSLALTIRFRM